MHYRHLICGRKTAMRTQTPRMRTQERFYSWPIGFRRIQQTPRMRTQERFYSPQTSL